MAVIAMFYGIIVSMYYLDNMQHHMPHIHVKYQDQEAIFSIPDGTLLKGSIKENKSKLVLAWIEIHKEDLLADWELAVNGQKMFQIDPLR